MGVDIVSRLGRGGVETFFNRGIMAAFPAAEGEEGSSNNAGGM